MDTPRHPPTPRRIRDARRSGDVVRSRLFTATYVWSAAIVLSLYFGVHCIHEMQELTQHLWSLIARPPQTTKLISDVAGACWPLARLLSFWCVVLMAVGLLANVLQVRPLFALGLGVPTLSRVRSSVYSSDALQRIGVELGVFVALSVCLLLGFSRLWAVWELHGVSRLDLCVAPLRALCAQWCVVGVVFGGLDLFLVWQARLKRLRMTDRERALEYASQHVDPEIEKARRTLQGEEGRVQGGLDDVPDATLVVYGPARAVALLYVEGSVPIVSAVGFGPRAVAILARASFHHVPTFRVPELARVLSGVALGGLCPDMLLPEVARWVARASKERSR